MNDTWVEQPAIDGVVLVGDAAGHSDPLIGEGLSVAMRDVRLVSETMLGSDDWSPAAFAGYATERDDRMRRLRFFADLVTTLNVEFVPEAIERRRRADERFLADPELFMLRAGVFVGPEVTPAELFCDDDQGASVRVCVIFERGPRASTRTDRRDRSARLGLHAPDQHRSVHQHDEPAPHPGRAGHVRLRVDDRVGLPVRSVLRRWRV